jgi:tagaturonate reductase
LRDLRERLLNPFLQHRIAEIAQNHVQKRLRRLAPIVSLAEQLHCVHAQPRLRAALANADRGG